jgi:hypothetical protein
MTRQVIGSACRFFKSMLADDFLSSLDEGDLDQLEFELGSDPGVLEP